MNLKYLATVAAASALMGGAALAQPNSVTPDQPNPVAAAQGHSSTSGHSTTTGSTASTDTSVNSSTSADTSTSSTTATSATTSGADVSVTTTLVTNGPVPDTAENRAKYGQPMSRAGKRTAAAGN
jgi:hypothetical protein